MEDWKIKIAGLWIFKALASLTFTIIMLMEEGVLEGIIAGEVLGMEIGPEMLLVGAIEAWAPLVMIVVTLTLKYKANRWTNIIVGTVFTALSLMSMAEALSAHGILLWGSQAVATASIVWLAWKWPKQEA